MSGDAQTTFEELESTAENRAEIGCHGREVGDQSSCWCGYHVVDGYGCCPECCAYARCADVEA